MNLNDVRGLGRCPSERVFSLRLVQVVDLEGEVCQLFLRNHVRADVEPDDLEIDSTVSQGTTMAWKFGGYLGPCWTKISQPEAALGLLVAAQGAEKCLVKGAGGGGGVSCRTAVVVKGSKQQSLSLPLSH